MTATRLVRASLVAVVAFAAPVFTTMCSRTAPEPQALYHCPMHPTYVSDRPGDCPICGMKLVPVGKAEPSGGTSASGADSGPAPQASMFVCPMPECGTVSDHPGRCPKCGMDLVPAPAARATPPGMAEVAGTPEGLRLLGIRTVAAVRGRLERTVRAVGHVTADETRVYRVHTKIAGFVERLFVNQTGQAVRKGQPLLAIYSAELLASQEEFLRALDAARRFANSALPEVQKGGQDLLQAARRRLQLFDVPESFLQELERTGQPRRTVTLVSPASGVVTQKDVFEGQRVEPSMELLAITDLSRVWVEVALYEGEARGVATGTPATLALAYDPMVRREGRVAFIHPTLDAGTRTLKVRLEFANPDGRLRPGDFANVVLAVESADGLIVPDTAVLDTGERQVVFVAAAQDRFVPRRVVVSLRANGQALIAEGLQEGETVASTAAFLLDSESRIRSAVTEGPAPAEPAAHEGHPR